MRQSTPAQLESAYHETYFHLLFKDELLTRAFRQPSSLAEDAVCCQQLEAARVGPEHGQVPLQYRRVVFVGQEKSKRRLAYFFVVWAVLGLFAGIAAGLVTKTFGTGAAVGCGLLSFVSILQGACVFACK